MNPENYCFPSRHRLFGQTTKQPISNFNLENIATLRAEIWPELLTKNCINSNAETSSDEKTEIVTPENWSISTDNLLSSLKKLCVCRLCHNEITTRKLTNYRGKLGTRFIFECVNEDCLEKETFYTTKKNKQIFKINKVFWLYVWLARGILVC